MTCDAHFWQIQGTCVRCGLTRLDVELAELIDQESGDREPGAE